MKIEIYSRAEMKKRLEDGPLHNTVVISFYDPPSPRTPKGDTPLDYTDQCSAVFPVAAHDIDPDTLPEYGLTLEKYLPEAARLALFIKTAVQRNLNIICQCEYGQSRSAGCAAAIREFFYRDGIRVFADYRYCPNQMIFNKILAALQTAGSE